MLDRSPTKYCRRYSSVLGGSGDPSETIKVRWRLMPPKLEINELRPYQAVLLAEIESGASLTAKQVMNQVKKQLKVKTNSATRKIVNSGASVSPDAAFIHYEDRR